MWICATANGHLQVIGADARGRKQYRYHRDWGAVRDEAKYERVMSFARALPRIRGRVESDMKLPGLPKEKVLATVVKLLEVSLIRIGNEEYARTNKSFGLTTMHNRHVMVAGATAIFEFRGKSGIKHKVEITDRRLATIVRKCQDLPGQRLFEYSEPEGNGVQISSEDVQGTKRGAESLGPCEQTCKNGRPGFFIGTKLRCAKSRQNRPNERPTARRRALPRQQPKSCGMRSKPKASRLSSVLVMYPGTMTDPINLIRRAF